MSKQEIIDSLKGFIQAVEDDVSFDVSHFAITISGPVMLAHHFSPNTPFVTLFGMLEITRQDLVKFRDSSVAAIEEKAHSAIETVEYKSEELFTDVEKKVEAFFNGGNPETKPVGAEATDVEVGSGEVQAAASEQVAPTA